jgi:hypothetical protein
MIIWPVPPLAVSPPDELAPEPAEPLGGAYFLDV